MQHQRVDHVIERTRIERQRIAQIGDTQFEIITEALLRQVELMLASMPVTVVLRSRNASDRVSRRPDLEGVTARGNSARAGSTGLSQRPIGTVFLFERRG